MSFLKAIHNNSVNKILIKAFAIINLATLFLSLAVSAADYSPSLTSVNPNSGNISGGNTITLNGSNIFNYIPIKQVVTNGDHSCALMNTGKVRCWGYNNRGQLGYGNADNIGDDETPASAGDINLGGIATQITAGLYHTCALMNTGKVRCWGYGYAGILGYGNSDTIGDDETPASAGDINLGGTAVQVSAGNFHTCALMNTGKVRCWGYGFRGRLGYGNNDNIGDDETPASAGDINLGGTVTQISVGGNHSCALLTTNNVRCWGYNGQGSFDAYGQLGYGNTNNIGDDETPASAGDVNVGGSVSKVIAGYLNTCVILTNGKVRCWGYNAYGQLGYANTNNIGDNETPASAGDVNVGGNVTDLAIGGSHVCVLLIEHNVKCWGYNTIGELGYGNTDNIGDNETPNTIGTVDTGGPVNYISAGAESACALLATGRLSCWGYNAYGQLGYGNTNNIGDNETPISAGDIFISDTILPSVTFDGLAATSINYINSSQLTVVAPAHSAGAVNVIITNPDSLISTLSNGYNYINPSSPVTSGDVTSSSCSPTTGLVGFTTTCTANFSSNHTGSITFSTNPNSGTCITPAITTNDTSVSCSFSVSATGSISVTATASGGGNSNSGNITSNSPIIIPPSNPPTTPTIPTTPVDPTVTKNEITDPYKCGGSLYGKLTYTGDYNDVIIKVDLKNSKGIVKTNTANITNTGSYIIGLDYDNLLNNNSAENFDISIKAYNKITNQFINNSEYNYSTILSKNCSNNPILTLRTGGSNQWNDKIVNPIIIISVLILIITTASRIFIRK